MHFSVAERKKALVVFHTIVEKEATWSKQPGVYTAKPK